VLRPGATPPQASLIDRGAVARKLAARALNLKDEIAALQRAALAEALALTGGNAAEAARLLGAVGRGRAKGSRRHGARRCCAGWLGRVFYCKRRRPRVAAWRAGVRRRRPRCRRAG